MAYNKITLAKSIILKQFGIMIVHQITLIIYLLFRYNNDIVNVIQFYFISVLDGMVFVTLNRIMIFYIEGSTYTLINAHKWHHIFKIINLLITYTYKA